MMGTRSNKIAVIDLGFNSLKLVTYRINKDNTFKAEFQKSVKVKLGEGMSESKNISRRPAVRAIESLKLFRDILSLHSINHVLPVATSAVREARNQRNFLKRIYLSTGFRFIILSSEQEALFSAKGAINSICFPTTMFFDLGGGSLELAYIEDFHVKKINSFPLGALRMSQIFGKKDGTYTDKNYNKMCDYIESSLPSRKSMNIARNCVFIGVGGVLRAIAKYDQDLAKYPLDKIHQYKISRKSIDTIVANLNKLTSDQISSISAIGSNRLETIISGTAAVRKVMQKYSFEDIIISTQGLREGVLSTYLEYGDFDGLTNSDLDLIKNSLMDHCNQPRVPAIMLGLIDILLSADILDRKEYLILTEVLNYSFDLPSISSLNNLFYLLMDNDNRFLNHQEQIIFALAIIHYLKPKAGQRLYKHFSTILSWKSFKSVTKISACLALYRILHKTRSRMGSISYNASENLLYIFIKFGREPIPDTLTSNIISQIESAFGVNIDYSFQKLNKPGINT